ncbi:hypothetical protein CLAFUW4_10564 [Fulvia fulva]|uniref:Uncharacterized protein n=1 Tax=Passalora fulva TaxID=5499 RepID=A0A9Q8LG66_PASFU|nr:uncharacterized protein CLAFUR5_05179 [Fulvia fulva]KAK4616252.1 hypothetical protein CLAFUR4_10569 [Fulvia fulva]KAK4616703.1 hypothetical protein CLAFUR0_10675 [Fulvia fulva]UJO16803.1 hypothetical protein CLAFUR5_05179 [Fulvia fulva]WPV19250.1 hypothetical protein CLAFUW4_10564 [Fulvia fulva]WPV33986.1 hypothetical protein CLAFUW7_10566 [Fulvia fulva]
MFLLGSREDRAHRRLLARYRDATARVAAAQQKVSEAVTRYNEALAWATYREQVEDAKEIMIEADRKADKVMELEYRVRRELDAVALRLAGRKREMT